MTVGVMDGCENDTVIGEGRGGKNGTIEREVDEGAAQPKKLAYLGSRNWPLAYIVVGVAAVNERSWRRKSRSGVWVIFAARGSVAVAVMAHGFGEM